MAFLLQFITNIDQARVAGRLYKVDFTCAPWFKSLAAPRGPPAIKVYLPATIWGARVDSLPMGERMAAPSCLVSKNGVYAACVQCDGNFVVYRINLPYDLTQGATPTWASNTGVTGAGSLNFNFDGNVNLLDANGFVVWSSLTKGRATPDSFLIIQAGLGGPWVGYYGFSRSLGEVLGCMVESAQPHPLL
jgi:hypothetical protein